MRIGEVKIKSYEKGLYFREGIGKLKFEHYVGRKGVGGQSDQYVMTLILM